MTKCLTINFYLPFGKNERWERERERKSFVDDVDRNGGKERKVRSDWGRVRNKFVIVTIKLVCDENETWKLQKLLEARFSHKFYWLVHSPVLPQQETARDRRQLLDNISLSLSSWRTVEGGGTESNNSREGLLIVVRRQPRDSFKDARSWIQQANIEAEEEEGGTHICSLAHINHKSRWEWRKGKSRFEREGN